jgi:hypothetical protein
MAGAAGSNGDVRGWRQRRRPRHRLGVPRLAKESGEDAEGHARGQGLRVAETNCRGRCSEEAVVLVDEKEGQRWPWWCRGRRARRLLARAEAAALGEQMRARDGVGLQGEAL